MQNLPVAETSCVVSRKARGKKKKKKRGKKECKKRKRIKNVNIKMRGNFL